MASVECGWPGYRWKQRPKADFHCLALRLLRLPRLSPANPLFAWGSEAHKGLRLAATVATLLRIGSSLHVRVGLGWGVAGLGCRLGYRMPRKAGVCGGLARVQRRQEGRPNIRGGSLFHLGFRRRRMWN